MPILATAVLALIVSVAQAHAQQASNDPGALWQQATIYRDEWGVPHVYADTPRAQAFAFGYAQAEDHLEAMLKAYRVANGRAAEVWGESYAESDAFVLRMGYATLAQEAFAQADPLTRDVCEGFAIGVNAYIVEHRDLAPAWADGARPADVLALMHCYLMSFAPFDLPNAYRFPMAATTGNAWAIAPSRSQSGKAMLVINPHTNYEGPFQWYEAHLVTQDLDVAGATLFGLPVILMGHNAVLGWALTPNQADFADVYVESAPHLDVSPKTPVAPQLQEQMNLFLRAQLQPRPYYVRTPDGLQQRVTDSLDTPKGPVIGEQRGELCAYRIGGYRDLGAVQQLIQMARARDLDGFRAALAQQQLPCFHVIYADRDGNIYYLYNAKVAQKLYAPPPSPQQERAANGEAPFVTDWNAPVPSSDARFEWGPIVPVQSLPQLVNPPSGYLQACGNPPWDATENSGIKQDALPPWFVHDRDSQRAQRARRLLGAGTRGFEDAQAILFDSLDNLALTAVPFLADAAKNQPALVASAHPDTPGIVDVLTKWDCVADLSSPGMTLFHVWWASLRRLSTTYPSESALIAAIENKAPDLQPMAIHAASETARVMRNEFDSLSVPWGTVHKVRRGNRFEPIFGAVTGEPLFVSSDQIYEDKVWRTTYGSGFAMAVEFGDRPRAVSVVPFGASDRDTSKHYDDQLALFLDRRLKPTYYGDEDVQQHAETAYGAIALLRPSGIEGRLLVRSGTGAPLETRLTTLADAPAALPSDMVPFTLFVSAAWQPQDLPGSIDVELQIPSAICSDQDLTRLALYAYDAQQGWQPLPEQQVEPARRAFHARDTLARTYAVLGPAQARLAQIPPPVPPPLEAAPSSSSVWNTPLVATAPAVASEGSATMASLAPPETTTGEKQRIDSNATVFDAPGFHMELLVPRSSLGSRKQPKESEVVTAIGDMAMPEESVGKPRPTEKEPESAAATKAAAQEEPSRRAPIVEPKEPERPRKTEPATPEFDPWGANQPFVQVEGVPEPKLDGLGTDVAAPKTDAPDLGSTAPAETTTSAKTPKQKKSKRRGGTP